MASISAAPLHNGLATLISQQQSYTAGLVYDVSPRVKAKLEVAFYENFGEYDYVTGYTAAGPTVINANGDGRFAPAIDPLDVTRGISGGYKDPGDNAAIYSFSIDAVF